MRILFLSPRQPWPTLSGAKLREYHFLRALGRQAELTYLYFQEPSQKPLTSEELPFCRDIVGVPRPSTYGLWNLMRGVLGRWPLPILNYTSAEMTAAIERLPSSSRYDLVHFDSIHMMRYTEPVTRHFGAQPRVVYNWHNIESEAMRRFSATTGRGPQSLYANLTAPKLERLERNILHSAFGHVVCSAREREQLLRIAPRTRIEVIENGVDTGYFAPRDVSGQVRNRIVFIGAMAYYPNAEAAASFARSIWPLVRERFPDLRFTIAGSNPLPPLLALRELPGVEVTGTVPDVRPYYQEALAAIVPLRTGGGTRLKILEAMAAGVPVISTPLGAEGLSVQPGKDILIAGPDDAEGWLRHIGDLHSSEERRASIREAGLARVRAHYDWEALGEALVDTYQRWLRSAG